MFGCFIFFDLFCVSLFPLFSALFSFLTPACQIFNFAGYSSNEWTLAGVQWAMCPTPVGTDQHANCSLGADVVSCSWGEDDATTDFLKDAIAAWLKAGMVPVFAVSTRTSSNGCLPSIFFSFCFYPGESDVSQLI